MILVADNLQITDPAIQKAVHNRDPEPIAAIVRECEAAGAGAIDINSGPLSRDPAKKMAFLVKTVQASTDLPVLIDTANPAAMAAGLAASQKKAVINGFSLEPGRLATILPLAVQYQVDIVGFLLLPGGQVPLDEDTRLSTALDLYQAALAAGLPPERLIIDPVIVPLLWQSPDNQAAVVLSVIRQLPDLLGFPVRTIAGISNLTTGRAGPSKKQLLEQTYLPMLAAAGLDMALLNMRRQGSVRTGRVCDALLSSKIFTWEEIPEP